MADDKLKEHWKAFWEMTYQAKLSTDRLFDRFTANDQAALNHLRNTLPHLKKELEAIDAIVNPPAPAEEPAEVAKKGKK